MSSKSKSTDKLMVLNTTVESIMASLSEVKREKLKSCKITWSSTYTADGDMATPELVMEFYE